jgi:signal transduction histidine kinase
VFGDTDERLISMPNSEPGKNGSVRGGAFIAIGFGLLLVAVLFDAFRPFGQQFSNLYFLIALYSAWLLRGRAEIALYVAVVLSIYLVPMNVRPQMPLFNRTTGILVGLAVVALIRDRRRLIQKLQEANRDLERKIADRTADLKASQQRLAELSRELITTQETERLHLAHELHDEIGQVLTAMKMNLRRLQREPAANSNSILAENFEMIDNAINQVRNLAIHLHPPHLEQLGLIPALRWLLKQQARIASFEEKMTVVPTEIQVPAELGLVCFRIAQEAVTNAVRHASPSQIEIEVRQENTELHLVIRDDGIGFDVSNVNDSTSEDLRVGLNGMRERASLAHGVFAVDSGPGKGTTIDVRFRQPT